jgi:hypothetical protein
MTTSPELQAALDELQPLCDQPVQFSTPYGGMFGHQVHVSVDGQELFIPAVYNEQELITVLKNAVLVAKKKPWQRSPP